MDNKSQDFPEEDGQPVSPLPSFVHKTSIEIVCAAAAGRTWEFSENDACDMSSLISRLQRPKNIIDKWLVNRLLPELRLMLIGQGLGDSTASAFETAILKELNRLIRGPALYSEHTFRFVKTRMDTNYFVHRCQRLPDVVVPCFNRLLLEDAFPEELSSLRVTQKLWQDVVAMAHNFPSPVIDHETVASVAIGSALTTFNRLRFATFAGFVKRVVLPRAVAHHTRIAKRREDIFVSIEVATRPFNDFVVEANYALTTGPSQVIRRELSQLLAKFRRQTCGPEAPAWQTVGYLRHVEGVSPKAIFESKDDYITLRGIKNVKDVYRLAEEANRKWPNSFKDFKRILRDFL